MMKPSTLTAMYALLREGGATFSGWGMTTTSTYPPWSPSYKGGQLKVVRDFESTHRNLLMRVKTKKIKLTQFPENHFRRQRVLEGLKWRHYFVFWSARLAALQASRGKINLAECGVCDGLTLFFAVHAVALKAKKVNAFAYDAWAPMSGQGLYQKENNLKGAYSHLSLENTQKNLRDVPGRLVYNQGQIPSSFGRSQNPSRIDWLHIDLKSASATDHSLEFFFSRLSPGALILFDDYGWRAHIETKKKIDRFVLRKNLNLLHLPTGQAIAFFQLGKARHRRQF